MSYRNEMDSLAGSSSVINRDKVIMIAEKADQEIEELKKKLEPFKDLIRIEPQPSWDCVQEIEKKEYSNKWYQTDCPWIFGYSPNDNYHPIQINFIWYWSL